MVERRRWPIVHPPTHCHPNYPDYISFLLVVDTIMIYILVYNEWDGGGGDYSENVVASSDKSKLEEYKAELEEKSKVLRDKLLKIDLEYNKKLEPLFEEFNPLVTSLMGNKALKLEDEERVKRVTRRQELWKDITAIQKEALQEKDAIKNEIDTEYWIDDDELANFTIDELEEI